jgi:N-acetylmuramoyl-L-alanine amidase
MDWNRRVTKIRTWICLCMAVLGAGCSLDVAAPEAGTPTLFIITSTLPPTTPPAASESPQPTSPAPTRVPIDGTTNTQLNVRGEPSTASQTFGILEASARVQILGRDPAGNWYQIVYGAAPGGKGWVTSRYVQVAAGVEIPPVSSDAGPSGVASQQINIRSGPGTGYDSIGRLNPQDVVTLTGKDASGSWLQIVFPAGPAGRGWVNAAFVQASGLESLPIVTEGGAVVGTGTPAPTLPALTPTPGAAFQDGDSADHPAVDVTFSPGGTRALIYTSDLSTPDGDAQDWVAFRPSSPLVTAALACEGNGALTAEIWRLAQPETVIRLACGESSRQLTLTAGEAYIVHLQVAPAGSGLQYIRYTLSMETAP